MNPVVRKLSVLVPASLWGLGAVWLLLAGGCTTDGDRLFTRLDSDQTGVDFANTITQDDTLMNPVDFFYVYNGGGVAAGDLNGDGRTDLYFAGNTVENRLYLNQGDLQFRDVTDRAKAAASDVWSTGVTLVDINQDGRTDIYVSVGGPTERTADRANRLYVNQGTGDDGVPTFEERADAYGIADSSYTTHSAFFDADQDGDLDLYVLNTATVRRRGEPQRGSSGSNVDRLYRNEGDGTFTDISDEAGITDPGYGLGVAIGDVNDDGWPDIYAANDLDTNDLLYINDGDGTFTNRTRQYLDHLSYSAMGVDVADVNNDARQDILVLDMLPKDPRRRRLISTAGTNPQGIWQYRRNTLQLNNGPSPEGHPTFSEVGQLAGLESADWGWAPLLADYDNDGDRDLFVSNGFGELVTHLDFVRRRRQVRLSGSAQRQHDALIRAMKELPEARVPNRFFENTGGAHASDDAFMRFAERTGDWAAERPGISNGAAFADLDQDGDLDLVTNNVNAPATLLENQADERKQANALRVDLHGPPGNRGGYGAEVTLTTDRQTQSRRHARYRGYQSTVEQPVHFGLGADSTADSLTVVWPDGTRQVRTDVPANQTLDLRYDSTAGASNPDNPSDAAVLFREVAAQRGLDHRHQESSSNTLRQNPLLPHSYAKNGPGLAVADVDGNGLDDLFVGADQGRERTLYRQVEPGRFEKTVLSIKHRYSGPYSYEDMGALFFDADGDGDQDLYVVSGGSIGPLNNSVANYQDRLYLNDGTGTFRRAEGALPAFQASGGDVTAADYDEDGDLDLLVGGRVTPNKYPLPAQSVLLRNDSGADGVQFTDVTAEVAPALADIGLVTDALWTDFNDDGQVDLLVVGEWMPITFLENQGGHFKDVTAQMGLPRTTGWWNSLAAGDFDRDDDTEYVAGNLGLNTRFEASTEAPVQVHAKDFSQDGQVDPVLSQVVQGTRYPAHSRDELTGQIRRLTEQIPTQEAYAEASFRDLFPKEGGEDAYTADAVRFETSYLDQTEDGTFEIRALPRRIQTAPVFGMRTGDYNGDGALDLLMVGNWFAPDKETGKADAFVGAVLRGDGQGQFRPMNYTESGFFVEGDAKALAEIATGDRSSLVVATQNNDSLKAFRPVQREGRFVPLRPLDRYATLTFKDGSTRRDELYHGESYLSQSSRRLWIPDNVAEVVVHGADGDRRVPGKAP